MVKIKYSTFHSDAHASYKQFTADQLQFSHFKIGGKVYFKVTDISKPGNLVRIVTPTNVRVPFDMNPPYEDEKSLTKKWAFLVKCTDTDLSVNLKKLYSNLVDYLIENSVEIFGKEYSPEQRELVELLCPAAIKTNEYGDQFKIKILQSKTGDFSPDSEYYVPSGCPVSAHKKQVVIDGKKTNVYGRLPVFERKDLTDTTAQTRVGGGEVDTFDKLKSYINPSRDGIYAFDATLSKPADKVWLSFNLHQVCVTAEEEDEDESVSCFGGVSTPECLDDADDADDDEDDEEVDEEVDEEEVEDLEADEDDDEVVEAM